jgi:hypothetical protein
MAAIQVPTAYRQLVKLVAHAFYGGDCPPKEYLDAADPAKAASAAAKAAAPPKPGNKQQVGSTKHTQSVTVELSGSRCFTR